MLDRKGSGKITLNRSEIPLEEGLLSLNRHLFEVFFYKASQSLTDDPESQLKLSVLTINLVEKLAP